MDTDSLVKEDVYSDQKVGSVRVLTPVTANGEIDSNRAVTYFGQTQVMTQGGAIPLNFELKTESLADAFEAFGDAAKESMEQTMKEIQEYQREQASKIVVPGQGSGSQVHMP
ncbi:MAG: hypothetical protein COB38_00910 [Gammaproteobacteria bacterium]|nr:MAG: hypothetical protein COB38_00910 [Gammaproteobacteria bacterium]